MVEDDFKRLDRRLKEIGDPFGTGFPILKSIIEEIAKKNGISVSQVIGNYTAWKWKK